MNKFHKHNIKFTVNEKCVINSSGRDGIMEFIEITRDENIFELLIFDEVSKGSKLQDNVDLVMNSLFQNLSIEDSTKKEITFLGQSCIQINLNCLAQGVKRHFETRMILHKNKVYVIQVCSVDVVYTGFNEMIQTIKLV